MISIIVACSKGRVIGNKGKIPWYLKKDLENFKKLTKNNVVIMGKNTFEEINKPLKDRINVVVSETIYNNLDKGKEDKYVRYSDLLSKEKKAICIDKVYVVKCLSEAIVISEKLFEGGKEIFLAGGEKIFQEGLALAQKLYITKIDMEFAGDRYFPEFDENLYDIIEEKYIEDEIPFKFVIYSKK